MTFPLRSAVVLLLALVTFVASAQTYPSKAIRLVVPFAPGGGTDLTARIVAQKLSENFGQQVVVDNRGGAGTIVGTQVVVSAPPDGYTLLIGTPHLTTLPSLGTKLPYDPSKDVAPITNLVSTPNLLVIHPSLPAKTVKELIVLAKARPGTLNYSSAGVGGGSHLSAELFKAMAGIDMVHVPYKGAGPALIDLLAGNVATYFGSVASSLPHVKSGRLRALGVTGLQRSTAAPDVPTIAEAGVPGFEVSNWNGLLGPAAVPKDIIDKLHREVGKVLQAADVKERFLKEGFTPVGNSPAEFAAYLKAETAKWTKVIKSAGIRAE
jgi:tripartite-type tricarboxylate transporter receptor subunit TctC